MRKLCLLLMMCVFGYGVDACHIRIEMEDDARIRNHRVVNMLCLDGYLYSTNLATVELTDLQPVLVYETFNMNTSIRDVRKLERAVMQKTCKCPGHIDSSPKPIRR